MRCYICKLLSDEIILKEHEDARWLGPDELETVEWLPADIEIVEKLRSFMSVK